MSMACLLSFAESCLYSQVLLRNQSKTKMNTFVITTAVIVYLNHLLIDRLKNVNFFAAL